MPNNTLVEQKKSAPAEALFCILVTNIRESDFHSQLSIWLNDYVL